MSQRHTPMITKRMLRGACKEQREIFRGEWPNGAPATLENVLRAVELGLDLDWGGERWFTPEALAEYQRQVATLLDEYGRQRTTLWAEYQRQVATLLDEYGRQRTTLWAEYQRQVATLLDEYGRQVAPLWAEYQRQVAPLRAEYQRQVAPLWLAAFLASQGEMGL